MPGGEIQRVQIKLPSLGWREKTQVGKNARGGGVNTPVVSAEVGQEREGGVLTPWLKEGCLGGKAASRNITTKPAMDNRAEKQRRSQ